MPRIVSLIASATEIVCALGMEEHLVGRSHECDYPASITELPVCTEPKFDVEGDSRQIDQRVKSILQNATSVYRVHAELLRKLQPDFIITQTQCEVCAVSEKDVQAAMCEWLDQTPVIVSLEPNKLADVWDDIARVAAALDIAERGRRLVGDLKASMRDIKEKAAKLTSKPAVACLEWTEPLMAGGNWMPELVEMAGGHNLFGRAGKHSPTMNWADLMEENPDIIVSLPCGYDLQRTRMETTKLADRPGWAELKAVQSGRVYVTDGNQYFNRPGPRLVESLEILAEIIHPEDFRFGHEGVGWRRLP